MLDETIIMKIYFGLIREENLFNSFRNYTSNLMREKLEKFSIENHPTVDETKTYMKSFIKTINKNSVIIDDFLAREYRFFLESDEEYVEIEYPTYSYIIITDESFLKDLSDMYSNFIKAILNTVWKNDAVNLTNGRVGKLKEFLLYISNNEDSLNRIDELFKYIRRLHDKINVFKDIKFFNEYMYEVNYDYVEYDYALSSMNDTFTINNSNNNSVVNNTKIYSSFANNNDCSTFRKDNIFAKNYDYIYNEDAEFIVKTSNSFAKYASVGIAHIPNLTNDQVKKLLKDNIGNEDLENVIDPCSIEFASHSEIYYSDIYRVLPFSIVDGINSEGVAASCQFINSDLDTINTNKNCSVRIPSNFLVRYILDNYSNVMDAMVSIRNELNIYSSKRGEMHLLIADKNDTFYISFSQNNVKITKLLDKPYITNFNLDGAEFSDDNLVYQNSLYEYSTGVERYNLISNNYGTVADMNSSIELLKQLDYKKTYSYDTVPFWYSEYVSKKNNFSLKDTDYSKLTPIINAEMNKFSNRSRNSESEYYGTWHTKHSIIYDLDNLEIYLSNQENFDEYKVINF